VSVVVMIGGIMLAGIVVNNGIVLIDLIGQLRRGGATVAAAILEAGTRRLRPILMTTLTTVLGLVPMAIGRGEGAEIGAPLAVTVIGGLSVATVLTLVLVPVLYSLVHREA
jgi:multidrug efflux pump subunit AcrB